MAWFSQAMLNPANSRRWQVLVRAVVDEGSAEPITITLLSSPSCSSKTIVSIVKDSTRTVNGKLVKDRVRLSLRFREVKEILHNMRNEKLHSFGQDDTFRVMTCGPRLEKGRKMLVVGQQNKQLKAQLSIPWASLDQLEQCLGGVWLCLNVRYVIALEPEVLREKVIVMLLHYLIRLDKDDAAPGDDDYVTIVAAIKAEPERFGRFLKFILTALGIEEPEVWSPEEVDFDAIADRCVEMLQASKTLEEEQQVPNDLINFLVQHSANCSI